MTPWSDELFLVSKWRVPHNNNGDDDNNNDDDDNNNNNNDDNNNTTPQITIQTNDTIYIR